ncbi:MAG: hypothetical protein IPJ66_11840 [Bacteroidetes bacterium]|nr:hypothetical protein [Bacteroidota bacterium]
METNSQNTFIVLKKLSNLTPGGAMRWIVRRGRSTGKVVEMKQGLSFQNFKKTFSNLPG